MTEEHQPGSGPEELEPPRHTQEPISHTSPVPSLPWGPQPTHSTNSTHPPTGRTRPPLRRGQAGRPQSASLGSHAVNARGALSCSALNVRGAPATPPPHHPVSWGEGGGRGRGWVPPEEGRKRSPKSVKARRRAGARHRPAGAAQHLSDLGQFESILEISGPRGCKIAPARRQAGISPTWPISPARSGADLFVPNA